MKRTKRKLELKQKVVVELSNEQLEQVVGGGQGEHVRTTSCTSTGRCPA
ncbi:MAG TPA: hypothetical protein VFQ53_38130 [Kofleriaceae bacterium]|nr:hypothetical protein [Kofleriaceae bacterium]